MWLRQALLGTLSLEIVLLSLTIALFRLEDSKILWGPELSPGLHNS